ncbi:unnamed protein product [Amoebophrya sp. A25]|nr:unnamed protein product [Amoebophrya sp. A25]|eukprot:GSA25T00026763001.1
MSFFVKNGSRFWLHVVLAVTSSCRVIFPNFGLGEMLQQQGDPDTTSAMEVMSSISSNLGRVDNKSTCSCSRSTTTRGSASTSLGIVFAQAQDLHADWTSYSEQADMPMSAEWRASMREKLRQVDPEALSPEQKIRYKQLMRQLNGHSTGNGAAEEEEAYPLQKFGILLAIVAFLAYQHFRGGGGGVAAAMARPQTTGAASGQRLVAQDQSEEQRRAMREARLRTFEKPTSEPMPNPWG